MAKKKVKKPNKPQKELIAVMILSLLLGFGSGFLVSSAFDNSGSSETKEEMSHSDKSLSHGSHDLFEVSAADAPSVKITVTEDAKSGYNVHLDTVNFEFAPKEVNKNRVLGEGHAHLYVDGEKISRLYGPDFHYNENFEGEKVFKVTLNANNHSDYAVNGNVVSDATAVSHDSESSDHEESHSH